jgi:hypothetical protein
MGNLYSDGVSPAEIKKMPYHELKYWSRWHDIIQEEYSKAAEPSKGKK